MKVDVPRLLAALRIDDARFRSKEYWAICPFPQHNDNDPSWSIRDEPDSPAHGFHKCFGCKRGGGPVALVQARLGITASSARRWLYEQGLVLGEALGAVPELNVVVGRRHKVPKVPGTVRFVPMDQWPTTIRRYAEEVRHITPQHVFRYRLGYAVQGRLAGRIVFPSYNARMEVTNYTARTAFSGTRYLNPDKKDGFPEYASVFGEHLWVNLPKDIIFTTEGAVNGLAIDSALGGRFAIGGMFGSTLKPAQILKIGRFTRVVHVSDPDVQGTVYSYKLRDALARVADVRIVQLREGDADDTPIQELKEALHAQL